MEYWVISSNIAEHRNTCKNTTVRPGFILLDVCEIFSNIIGPEADGALVSHKNNRSAHFHIFHALRVSDFVFSRPWGRCHSQCVAIEGWCKAKQCCGAVLACNAARKNQALPFAHYDHYDLLEACSWCFWRFSITFPYTTASGV